MSLFGFLRLPIGNFYLALLGRTQLKVGLGTPYFGLSGPTLGGEWTSLAFLPTSLGFAPSIEGIALSRLKGLQIGARDGALLEELATASVVALRLFQAQTGPSFHRLQDLALLSAGRVKQFVGLGLSHLDTGLSQLKFRSGPARLDLDLL
jgi:hypothetical protein